MKMKVMLVDDEQDIRELYARILNREGCTTIHSFSNGADAVAAVEQETNDTDVMVIDYQMPKMDGVEATRRIRGVSPNIKVIMASGSDNLSDFDKSLFDAILTKPISFRDLVNTIRRISTS